MFALTDNTKTPDENNSRESGGRQIILLADAYPRIPNALYVASRNFPTHPITILVIGSKDLYGFFTEINSKCFDGKIKLVFIELFKTDPKRPGATLLKKACYLLWDIFREKQYLKRLYREYLPRFQDCDVYSFNMGYFDFFITKKLAGKNRLFYISSYPTQVTPNSYIPDNVIDLGKWLANWMVFGSGMGMGRLPHLKGFRQMSRGFMRKRFDSFIDGEERDTLMKNFDLAPYRVFNPGSFSVLYFPQSMMASDYIVDPATFQQEMTAIFRVVGKHFRENEIACKYHPGYADTEKSVVSFTNVLPDYIPAEFLYGDNVKVYLGFFSSAIANVTRGNVISLMYLISFRDDGERERLRAIIESMSHTEVRFPRTLEEFGEMLASARSAARAVD